MISVQISNNTYLHCVGNSEYVLRLYDFNLIMNTTSVLLNNIHNTHFVGNTKYVLWLYTFYLIIITTIV